MKIKPEIYMRKTIIFKRKMYKQGKGYFIKAFLWNFLKGDLGSEICDGKDKNEAFESAKKIIDKNKKSWKNFITLINKKGYEILWVGKCIKCGGKACQVYKKDIIYTKCENNDWEEAGFGETIPWGKLSDKEQKKIKKEEQEKIDEKQKEFKNFLTS